jgi:hypothetical protein
VEWIAGGVSQSPVRGYGVLPRSALRQRTAEYLLPQILHVPQLFFWIPRLVIRHFLGIRASYSIYPFVFHLDIHLALPCLPTYLCIIGG